MERLDKLEKENFQLKKENEARSRLQMVSFRSSTVIQTSTTVTLLDHD